MAERCKTVDGVHIPGCYPCVHYGHHACVCEPVSWKQEIARLERRIEKLESRASTPSDPSL